MRSTETAAVGDAQQLSKDASIASATKCSESTEGMTPSKRLDETHASQASLSQVLQSAENQLAKQLSNLGSTVMQAAAENLRRREEMEAKEIKQHKADFIDFCRDALTQHKMENQGNALPDAREKYRVLQTVIDDQPTLMREEGRNPTVAEYGQFITGVIRSESPKLV